MENGIHNGMRTNHDRDTWMNGVSGSGVKREISPDKDKPLVDSMLMANGTGDSFSMDLDGGRQGGASGTGTTPNHLRMDDLPDELQHITTDILPLGLLLTRLAQWSHGKLLEEIDKLASKPIPHSALNGNGNYNPPGAEDSSAESLEKKAMLLKFLQELHGRWVKALVITDWSKKANQVGKLIDIRGHLLEKLHGFQQTLWDMVELKRELVWAKVPSPDLKSALQVLGSGEVSWMPDLGYLEPPPVSMEECETWIDNINTMLSVRLSFDEYDRIPPQFRDYTIANGRATFRVEGEFEVDLTIGDDDFEKQFWFIDLRFLWTPRPAEMSEPVRAFLDGKVNLQLGTDGLAGCYKYLHEFCLTQKIIEYRRQAAELSVGRWIQTLKYERLNRSMSIQYWLNRSHSQGLKSWIIIGVHSGQDKNGSHDSKATSHIGLRWFRDNKEVHDFDIPLNTETISTENLLTTVIARHVQYLLTSICSKLLSKPRFSNRQARLDLHISKDDAAQSSLTVQLFDNETVTVRIDPLTGSFILSPQSTIILRWQQNLNSCPNPAEDGPNILEQLRWLYTTRDISSRCRSNGWQVLPRIPVSQEDLKTIVNSATPSSREPYRAVWLRKAGWNPQWFVMMSMSLSGDRWWLVELYALAPFPMSYHWWLTF